MRQLHRLYGRLGRVVVGYFRIRQIRSQIRRHHSQRKTLQGLGLNKIGRIATVPFNGSIWGMVQKVRHLIDFPDQQLLEAHRLILPQPINEALMRQLLFEGLGLDSFACPRATQKAPTSRYSGMVNYWATVSLSPRAMIAFSRFPTISSQMRSGRRSVKTRPRMRLHA